MGLAKSSIEEWFPPIHTSIIANFREWSKVFPERLSRSPQSLLVVIDLTIYPTLDHVNIMEFD